MRIQEKTLAILLVLSLVMNVFLLVVVLVSENDLSQTASGSGEIIPGPVVTTAPRPPPGSGAGAMNAASMQAPVILQTIEVDRGSPFTASSVTEKGAMVNVSVEVVPGKGRVLVQTTPRTGIVFQDAANLAVSIAVNRSHVNLAESDVIFSIQGPDEISEIDGPSAGALMTALLLSVLEGFELNESVTVTGSIDEDGHIGSVGGILEKAEAAVAGGKTLLILPEESNQIVGKREDVRSFAGLMIARQRPVVTDAKEFIEANLGIRVKYVDTLDDLLADVRAPAAAPVVAAS